MSNRGWLALTHPLYSCRLLILFWVNVSKCTLNTFIKMNGLYLPGLSIFPLLTIGITVVTLQSSGLHPLACIPSCHSYLPTLILLNLSNLFELSLINLSNYPVFHFSFRNTHPGEDRCKVSLSSLELPPAPMCKFPYLLLMGLAFTFLQY